VRQTFPFRNQPPDLISKGFSLFFPSQKIKVESSKIEGAIPINGLIPKNHEHTYHEQFLCTRLPFPFVELPIEFGKKKNPVFLHKRDQKLVWVNLRSYIINELGVIGKYKKSFLPIGGINN